MALITMAVYDTVENKRSSLTQRCLDSLMQTVNFKDHRLIVIDNNSCEETKTILSSLLKSFHSNIRIIFLKENVGTANAINEGLKYRGKDEFCIKMDNDVVFHKMNWIEEMQDCIERMPLIGILGLKRKDVCESVYALDTNQRSKLIEVPHQPGQNWYVVEECKHVMGTCTMLNPVLLDKIGYFYQMGGLYGFDDSLLCVRSALAGFKNCFMHGISIDHIDPGGDAYTDWKRKYAGEMIGKYAEAGRNYNNGLMNIYYNPFEK